MAINPAEILQFQIRRDVTNLYKRHLNQIEDLRQEHASMLKKLEEALPPQYHSLLRSADYFNDEKFNHLRKRVLDAGNESVRGIEEQLKQFEVGFGFAPKR